MKPENTEERRKQRKRSAVRGVLLFALLQLACAACFGALCFIPELPQWCVVLFGGLAALCLVLILPALLVLKDRFKEIEGGELDAAGKY